MPNCDTTLFKIVLYRCLDLIRHNIGTYLKHKKYMFDIPIPFCHNLYLSATLKQFLTEFAARYNLLHHVYMSIPVRIPTCNLIGRLFSCSRRDIVGDEDAVLSFCWYFPNLNLQHITSEINPLQLCIIPGNIKNTLNSTK